MGRIRVNICSRLIDDMLKNGYQFLTPVFGTIKTDSIPLGLYAETPLKQDEIIREMTGELLNTSTPGSIHIGHNMYIMDICGKYINHSFRPNVRIEYNKIIALRDIEPWEEITFNHALTKTF